MEQFDFASLKRQYGITGVVHVGSHYGDEGWEYLEAGLDQVIMIEADPVAYEEMSRRFAETAVLCVNALVTDTDSGYTKFFKSNNEVSSSIYEFKDHLSYHPSVTMVDEFSLHNNRLDTVISDKPHDKVNCLVVDVQGAEKLVFAGATALMKQIDVVITEYSTAEMYDGGTMYYELEEILFGFERVAPVHLVHHGDALFVRRNK